MAHDSVRGCEFRTPRLAVGEWHEAAGRLRLDLVEIVTGILTPTTTSELPPEWQGHYDDARAETWIDDRDRESPTLLVVDHRAAEAIGLVILFESRPDPRGPTDVRVGYVITESAWGQGYASELVDGLVAWGRSHPSIGSMSGGVSDANHASAHVLLKNGFHRVGSRRGERIYRITFGT